MALEAGIAAVGVHRSIRNPEGIWINSRVFSSTAQYFDKHGTYIESPISSDPYSEYRIFWTEEDKRCREGHTVGGARITGDHYNYLNFTQIKLTEGKSDDSFGALTTAERRKRRAASKIVFFPDFWDGDYDYFHCLEIARWGVDNPSDVKKLYLNVEIHPEDIYGGLFMIVAKARRKGFSFKNASLVVNRYKREPNSISVVAAYDSRFLYPEGTTAMVDNYIDFFNEHTAWRRRKLIDRMDHVKDGYVISMEGVDIEKGYKSQILSIPCHDNPDALRGKDGTLILLEESGKWPTFLPTLDSTIPALSDGVYTTGMLVAFGTGGGDNINWEGFREAFYAPESYNFMRFKNVWDKGAEGTFCGFYFANRLNKKGFIDKQGNSDTESAFEFEVALRKKIQQSTRDPDRLKRHKMENAESPSEAFALAGNNIFPTEEIEEWKNVIEAKKLDKLGIPGKIEDDKEGKVRFLPDYNLVPVNRYPHKGLEDITGCIVRYYDRFTMPDGSVPDNLYIICHDPYNFDKSTGQESLGATYVIMNPNNIVPGFKGGDLIVASYIGKPASLDEYNKNLFLLAKYYNAKIGFENDRGDVIGFAKRNPWCFNYLESEFELGWTGGVMNNRLGRGYGMSMGAGKDNKKIVTGDVYIRDWLNTVRYVDEAGKAVKNLHTILDIGLLQEFLLYGKGNFDRISCLRIGMYHQKELLYNNIAPDKSRSTFAGKTSFSKFVGSKLCA